jgi:hypothetical protein
MSDLQGAVNAIGAMMQRHRAATQMTLGGLIDALTVLAPERRIVGLGSLDSYRGYYADLAFSPSDEPRIVAGLLAECRAAVGETFVGYKGGEFLMGVTTPLWVAPWGECGERLMGLNLNADPIRPTLSPDDGMPF